jgi:hypothetical protein
MPNGPAVLPIRRRPHWRAAALLLAAALAVLLTVMAFLVRAERWSGVGERTPMEFVRYAERRLIGHPNLQSLFGPALTSVRRMHEREPPANLPTLGKGQQPAALVAPGYDASGRPRAVNHTAVAPALPATPTVVRSVEALAAAMASAMPGQVIEVAAGSYALARTLSTGHAATAAQPIVVRASKPGSVDFVVTAQQGVNVSQPYWVFENLNWRGACPQHDDCEHAFHVVGRARGTVILNNRISDFNAHLKINGEGGEWPDDGLLQFTTLLNSEARRTELSVSPIDLVGANGWQLLDNLVQRTAKDGGSRVSYGMCLKGAGRQVQVERNLIVCTPERVSAAGLRVGISLGCGATGQEYCRDGRCDVEMLDGVVANNVVAHCNDFGIDLHRARNALVAHNTLINTAGIDARQATTRAVAVGNLLEGRLRDRDDAKLEARDNALAGALDTLLVAPDALDLRWHESSDRTRPTPETERDFCGQRRPPVSPPGATVLPQCDRKAPASAVAPLR